VVVVMKLVVIQRSLTQLDSHEQLSESGRTQALETPERTLTATHRWKIRPVTTIEWAAMLLVLPLETLFAVVTTMATLG
jgi:hypothetical protein